MTGKAPPIPPRDPNPNKIREMEKVVEKCEAVDEDALKRSPFRKMMEENVEEIIPKQPSPFDLFGPSSSQSQEKNSSSTNYVTPKMTTSYSSTMQQTSSSMEPLEPSTPDFFSLLSTSSQDSSYEQTPTNQKNASLPEAESFWQTADEPPDFPTQGASFERNPSYSFSYEENSYSIEESDDTSSSQETDLENFNPKDEKTASHQKVLSEQNQLSNQEAIAKKKSFDSISKKTALEDEKSFLSEDAIEKPSSEEKMGQPTEEISSFIPSILQNQPSLTKEAGSLSSEETQNASLGSILEPNFVKKETHRVQENKINQNLFSLEKTTQEKKKDKEDQKGQQETASSMKNLPPVMPSLTGFPQESLLSAQIAANQATPFLNKETLSLYFQMIGTITAMVKPSGDSHTEFVLNSPAFANSKFYGATINIDKFSTAPYQLNIRLTGPQVAVDAFNQNLSSLSAAFQRGNFSFTINRLEAVYKPLIQRKKREEK